MSRQPLTKARLRWRREKSPLPGVRLYTADVPREAGQIKVMVGTPEGFEGRWHLSISRNPVNQYPSWDHIAQAREDFLPDDLTFAMILPPRAEFVSLHPTTFHLYPVAVSA